MAMQVVAQYSMPTQAWAWHPSPDRAPDHVENDCQQLSAAGVGLTFAAQSRHNPPPMGSAQFLSGHRLRCCCARKAGFCSSRWPVPWLARRRLRRLQRSVSRDQFDCSIRNSGRHHHCLISIPRRVAILSPRPWHRRQGSRCFRRPSRAWRQGSDRTIRLRSCSVRR